VSARVVEALGTRNRPPRGVLSSSRLLRTAPATSASTTSCAGTTGGWRA